MGEVGVDSVVRIHAIDGFCFPWGTNHGQGAMAGTGTGKVRYVDRVGMRGEGREAEVDAKATFPGAGGGRKKRGNAPAFYHPLQ